MAGGLARFVRAVWRGLAVTTRRAGGASPSLDRATAESRRPQRWPLPPPPRGRLLEGAPLRWPLPPRPRGSLLEGAPQRWPRPLWSRGRYVEEFRHGVAPVCLPLLQEGGHHLEGPHPLRRVHLSAEEAATSALLEAIKESAASPTTSSVRSFPFLLARIFTASLYLIRDFRNCAQLIDL